MKHKWELSYIIREDARPVLSGKLIESDRWYEDHEYFNEAIASVDKRIGAFILRTKNSGIEFNVTEHYAKIVGESNE